MPYLYEVKLKRLDSIVLSWRGDESDYDLERVDYWTSRGYRVERFTL